MADITACDMCGKQSPDKDGLWLCNNWCKVSVVSRWRKYNRFADPKEFIFCLDCLPYKEGMDPTPKRLLKALKRFFGIEPQQSEEE